MRHAAVWDVEIGLERLHEVTDIIVWHGLREGPHVVKIKFVQREAVDDEEASRNEKGSKHHGW